MNLATMFQILGALLAQAVLVTVFMYKEFATKRDLRTSESHLKELMEKDQKLFLDSIHNLHQGMGELKETIKTQKDEILKYLYSVNQNKGN